jgi:hypothetical protein
MQLTRFSSSALALAAAFLLASPAAANEEDAAKDDSGWGGDRKHMQLIHPEMDALIQEIFGSLETDIVKLCELNWKWDESIPRGAKDSMANSLEWCKKQQNRSMRTISRYSDLFMSGKYRMIVIGCMNDSTDEGFTDWVMTEWCLRRKLQANEPAG